MKDYIITVNREHRGAMNDDWMDAVAGLDGVEVVSEDRRLMLMQVRASERAVKAIRERFEDWLHVEEKNEHSTGS